MIFKSNVAFVFLVCGASHFNFSPIIAASGRGPVAQGNSKHGWRIKNKPARQIQQVLKSIKRENCNYEVIDRQEISLSI